MVQPVPEEYGSVTPYLSFTGAADAIAFYKQAFGAQERMIIPTPDGKVGHAELAIGNSVIMLADECEHSDMHDPRSVGGTSMAIMLYVDDAEKIFTQAIAKGAQEIRPVEDQFYGDKMGTLRDPFGHVWYIATHMEDLTPEEVNQRAQAEFGP